LNTQKTFYDSQLGFRQGCSTVATLTELSSELLESFDNQINTTEFVLDFFKAFNTINHTTLLSKLRHYGVTGHTLEWFWSYISDRRQFVLYKNTKLLFPEVTCGVPQVTGTWSFAIRIIYQRFNKYPAVLQMCPLQLRHNRLLQLSEFSTSNNK